MAKKNVYVPAALRHVGNQHLGPGWAARCLRRGAMDELRERGLLDELRAVAGDPDFDTAVGPQD